MIDQFKKMYSFAQAGLAEGLDKGEEYSKTLTIETAKVLAQEHGKRNQEFQVSKSDIDAYLGAHQKDFDADMAFFTRNNPNKPNEEQLQGLKASWGELQFRAEKGRQTGLEKDPVVKVQLKMMRANLLANLHAIGFHFKDGTSVVRQATSQRNVKLHVLLPIAKSFDHCPNMC